MVTERQMAEAYIEQIKRERDTAFERGAILDKHLKECLEALKPKEEDNVE